MTSKIIKPVIWGLKNSNNILNLAHTVKNCDQCDSISSEQVSVCKNHKEEYDRLVDNGPYGRSFRDIIKN